MKTFFVSMLFFFGVVSCSMSVTSERIDPTGAVISENRTVGNFTAVNVSGGIELVLTKGDEQKVSIETHENLFQYIETSVSGNTLTIKRKNGINFKGEPTVKVLVTVNTLNDLSASGGSKVSMTNTITTDHLSINGSGGCSFDGAVECDGKLNMQLSGGGKARLIVESGSLKVGTSGGGRINLTGTSGDVDVNMSGGGHAIMDITCETLKSSTSGGGKLELTGSADSYTMSSSGGGKVDGFDFVTKHFSADMSGGGSGNVTVTETISMKASGGGSVNYKGDAVAQNVSLSGGGSLNKVN